MPTDTSEGVITHDLPPHDEDLERGVLGSILVQPDPEHSGALLRTLILFLEPTDFWREQNARLYHAVLSCFRARGRCLIGDLFGRQGIESDYLSGLAADCLDGTIVLPAAVGLAELGLTRMKLGASTKIARWDAAQVAAFNRRVQAKREQIDRIKPGGAAPREDFSPLGGS